MHPWQAALLGAVEGLTEFLPVSSTGHLILVLRWLKLYGEAVDTFAIVIQAGALGAVLGLYRARVASMWRGLLGQDAAGRALLSRLLVSFMPAAVVGVVCHRAITTRLFGVAPVAAALALGGAALIGVDWWMRRGDHGGRRSIESMGATDALLIGLAQCLSLWPGTSRAMVTLVTALLLGFSASTAAAYSFLLALPTLGAATAFDALQAGTAWLHEVGGLAIMCGFVSAALVAALAIAGFVRYLSRGGLAPFGWYRLLLSAVVWSAGSLA